MIPHPSHRARLPGRSRGFTMVELMVVVGIIIILAAILLPVISKARKSGYQAATLGRMNSIMSAIDNYYAVFNAYPGPISDAELLQAGTTTVGGQSYSGFTQQVMGPNNKGSLLTATGTENLSLGLLGGMTLTNATGTFQPPYQNAVFTPGACGSGPTSLTALHQQQYQPFINTKSAGLEPMASAGGWVPWSSGSHPNGPVQFASSYYDTAIPEFTDAYPDALPILYLRAVPGATGSIIGAQDAKTASNQNPIPVAAGNAAYDPSQLQPYLFPAFAAAGKQAAINTTSAGPGQGPTLNSSAVWNNPDPSHPGLPDDAVLDAATGFTYGGSGAIQYSAPQYYFGQTSAPSQPRSTKGYLLITAGPDRKFLTADDLINGSRAR